jgi:hypothetical protein
LSLDRGGPVDLARHGGHGGEVVFPGGEDVAAFALFEVVGVLEVDDRGGVNHEGGAAFGGSAAEFLCVLAFGGGDCVFDAAGGGANEVHETHPTAAKVEFVNGADRIVGSFFVAGIVGGVGDVMAVACPDFHFVELAEVGESVVVGAQSGELLTLKFTFDGTKPFEAARTGQAIEIVRTGQAGGVGMP